MIDETFLRQTAALQANLKMLESQQDVLSDLADMKELRLYKARLADYIEAHSKAGHLPPDPFSDVLERLMAVSDFFTAADQEYQRLTSWKKSWLKGIPNISLSDIQSARTELSNLVAELPHAQQRLGQMLSAQDWDTSSNTVDLHPELLACAQCHEWLILRSKEGSRTDLYQFAQGEGKLMKGVSAHLTAMDQRIEELNQLHDAHGQSILDAGVHALNQDFRSSEQVFTRLGKGRFSDLDYSIAKEQHAELSGIWKRFMSFDTLIDKQLENNEFQVAQKMLSQLGDLALIPGSELEREATVLLQGMESRLAIAQKAHKKRMVSRFVIISLIIAGLGAFSFYVVKETAKAEEARVIALTKAKIEAEIAQLKAEQDRIEAQAKAAQVKAEAEAAWAKSSGKCAGEEKIIEIAPGVSMTFCWCPAGKFTMGSPESEANRSNDEDQAEVTLSQGFWMAKTEVTQAQWQAVMGENPSYFKGANRPVEKVSWDDAQEFLTKLNSIVGNSDGGKLALPTEAQWEYAARAGEKGPYSGGSIDEVAWYDDNSKSETQPVGTKKANAWGLHDMHGNVWEWCADWYDGNLPGGVDPTGSSSGSFRVLRGGSWNDYAFFCRAAYRDDRSPAVQVYDFGFRIARSSVP